MKTERSFVLKQFGEDLLTRDQGARVRKELQREVMSLPNGESIVVSFEGVRAVTPSFVDECLGRLLLNLGMNRFRVAVHLHTTDDTVRRLVNRVLIHRAEEVKKTVTKE